MTPGGRRALAATMMLSWLSGCPVAVDDHYTLEPPTEIGDCTDGELTDGETGVDCGGDACAPCEPGDGCAVAEDCVSGVCVARVCQQPTCEDLVRNGVETDTDCGGATCAPCALGQSCGAPGDCVSNACLDAVCVAP